MIDTQLKIKKFNMDKQVLSVEQMQELIDMGIDTSNASMCWFPKMALNNNRKPFVESHFLGINHIDCDAYWNTTEGKNTIPTFTLQDILEMIPDYFWIEKFSNIYKIKDVDGDTYFESKSLLEAAFKILKWCKENNEI